MAAVTEQMLVRIAADTQSLRSELGRATAAARSTSNNMKRSFKDADQSIGVLGGSARGLATSLKTLGISLGAVALANGLRNVGREMDTLVNTSAKLGVSVETMQELRFAANEVGVQTSVLDLAFQRFTRRLGEARQGTGELKGTLDQYGIAVNDSTGQARTAEAVLRDLADTVAATSDEQERLRIAFKAFDSEGAALVNVLREGASGIDAFRQQARDLGLVLDELGVKKVAEFNRALERTYEIFTTKLKGAVVDVVDGFGKLISLFGDGGERSTEVLRQQSEHLTEMVATAERLAGGNFFERNFLAPTTVEQLERMKIELREIDALLQSRGAFGPAAGPDVRGRRPGVITPATAPPTSPIRPKKRDEKEEIKAIERQRSEEARLQATLDRQEAQRVAFLRRLDQEEARAAEDRIELVRIEMEERLAQLEKLGLSAEDHAARRAQIERTASQEIRNIQQEETDAAIEAFRDKQEAAEESARQTEATVLSSLQRTTTGYRDLRSAAISVAFDILQAFSQTPSGGGGGGLFSIFSSFFGGSGGGLQGIGPTPGTLITPFAKGGPFDAGQPMLVGEQGPELLLPKIGGAVVSNEDLGRAAKAPSATPTIYIDARGSNGEAAIEEAVRRGIKQAAPSLINASVKSVRDGQARNPRFLSGSGN